MKKVELTIEAVSNKSTRGYYGVLLSEKNGLRTISLIIGFIEAQAIFLALEKIKPLRPSTHDLFYNMLLAFNIDIKEVLIHKVEEGIFYSRLICQQGGLTLELDSRTSDALALAIRTGTPIYCYDEIIKESSDQVNPSAALQKSTINPEQESPATIPGMQHEDDNSLANLPLENLQQMLDEALENEDYMLAASIRDELKRRSED